DNNIEFWRKFVAEYFAPNGRKILCVSLYGNGRHTTGVFPQNAATLTEHGKYSSTPVLHQQVQTIRPDEPAQLETTFLKSVEHLTIKATYKKNTVSFSFILSDGFAKLEELISSKFQLKLGSFSLKYKDKD
ncbi:NLP3-like protein, partial [Tanacetum coccineum]